MQAVYAMKGGHLVPIEERPMPVGKMGAKRISTSPTIRRALGDVAWVNGRVEVKETKKMCLDPEASRRRYETASLLYKESPENRKAMYAWLSSLRA